ncbi:RNA polymerase factor sigma-54 [Roseomonas sp. NAR14]|uniref:RNA polymerase sigma-54 factor n=1 Tax=Roseomonas acroporae TaxID=2937791 RepID=A0A9X2BTK5_9PROT|nr:RNA polymerase factor sigma-54 [Roseomonas acroporae]MCK8784693.1 RNA polymerase factor sigma-54 [Roseomonas acroporae]
MVVLAPRLDLRHSQSLVMTPQLRQAIKLLQSSNLEVTAFVEEELERNPLLERDEREPLSGDLGPPEAGGALPGSSVFEPPPQTGDAPEPADCLAIATSGELPPEAAEPLDVADWSNVYESESGQAGGEYGRGGRADFADDLSGVEDLAAAGRTLAELLGEQIRLSFEDQRDRLIAAHLVALLDAAGRLSAETAAIAEALGCDPARVEMIRLRMQRFEPVGLFCRSLRECLAVQLAELNRLDPAMATLLDNLELLARREHRTLMRLCGVDAEDLADMVAELRRLDPKPGARYDQAPTPAVVPDVLMRRAPGRETGRTPEEGDPWLLELNPETLPRVLVNRGFFARAQVGARTREDKAFLAEQLQSANWLVKSLEQRANTILKVAAEIVRRQDAFFRHGIGHLRPLILRDVAETVAMHESTVSRVTSHKYIATPRGTFELKYFFTTAIAGTGGETHSAEAVRHRIRAMIDAEAPADILSDDAIVERLRQEGVDIARRTVAKYREALRIPSSVQRKREKAVPA